MKKIAFPTDDGRTISRHLGEAQFYLVALLDDAENVTFERREKPRRNHNHEERSGKHHGEPLQRGTALFAPLHDCQVLFSGRMGQPAYDHAIAQGLEVILPAEKNITDALDAFRNGMLISDLRRIHKHLSGPSS